MPGVFAALNELRSAWLSSWSMVTNQDGLGNRHAFRRPISTSRSEFMLEALRSQGIEFERIFVCPHRKTDRAVPAASPRPRSSRSLHARRAPSISPPVR